MTSLNIILPEMKMLKITEMKMIKENLLTSEQRNTDNGIAGKRDQTHYFTILTNIGCFCID